MKQSTFEKYCLVVDEWFVNGFNGTKAYQKYYPNASDENAEASFRKILGNTRVAEYAQNKRETISEKSQFTHESLVNDLIEIKDRCMQKVPVMVKLKGEMVQAQDENGNNLWTFDANAAIKAITELGKHDGKFYEKNNRDKSGTKSVDEMLAIREQLKQKYKE